MAPIPASVLRQAELLKLDGNTYFKKDRLGAAIDAYTEAIALCPHVAVYWTNRALCFQKRKEWAKVEDDCRKAIELDSNSVKAHYMLGRALLEKGEYTKGIKELEKALDLGRTANPTSYLVEETWQILADAKYMEWERSSCNSAWKRHNLKYQYLPLLNFNPQPFWHDLRYIASVCFRLACVKALEEHHFLDDLQDEDASRKAADEHSEQMKLLDEVFRKASIADTPGEVPDYLCCKIALEIFRDPVITPSGVTYERAVLVEHLNKVGKFDPITREPLEQYHLVPNLAMKEAVQAYLNEHGWAYKLN